MNTRPDLSRVPEFPKKYINLVSGNDLQALLQERIETTLGVLTNIPHPHWPFRYAPGKWSINEVVQHIIDVERIFCFRALSIARGETAPLPGFDENAYAAISHADKRTKEGLLLELKTVHQATALLFESFDETELERTGIANGNSIYVRAIGFIITGHVLHHLQVLQQRYL